MLNTSPQLLSDEAFTNLLNEELIFTRLSPLFLVVVVVGDMRQTGHSPWCVSGRRSRSHRWDRKRQVEGSARERVRKEGGSRGGVTPRRASFKHNNGTSLLLFAVSAPPATAAGCRA